MGTESEIVALLSELVRRPSVNPERNPMAELSAPFGEERVAAFVESYFAGLGLKSERQEVARGRDNLIVRVPGRRKDELPICLEAHMDTVGPEGMSEPFSPRIEAGRLHGRGSCDTKGSLAAMMLALAHVVRQGLEPALPVWLVAAADEEYGQGGAHRLAASGARFSGAIVGEPTRLEVVAAHNGQFYLRINAHGKAAHSSMPQNGVNAIYAMTDAVAVLRRRSASEYPRRKHALCGSPVLTVSIIEGGMSEHIVPDRCTIALDRRTIPGETTAEAVAELRRWLDEDLDATTAGRIEIVPPHHDATPLETPTSHPLVQGLAQASTHVLGRSKITGVPYNTDAGVLGRSGSPALVFGPGDIAQAHTAQEYVDIAELVAATEILERFLVHELDGWPRSGLGQRPPAKGSTI